MRNLLIFLIVGLNYSCKSSFINATFTNRNVYKTKASLTIKKVYHGDRPSTDQRVFTILPNNVPLVTKTITSISTDPKNPPIPSQTTTTNIVTTIPETNTTTTVTTVRANSPSGTTVKTTNTTFSIPPPQSTNSFIRYKVINDEGDFKYIRLLKGVRFDGISPADTNIVYNTNSEVPKDNPADYVFRVSKKDLVPNTHYLASSALIGEVITIPVRIRNEYWNDDNKTLQGTLAIGYGFGWKYKLGNHPYRPHYLTTILYAAGISQQNHFSIAGKHMATGKDSISAKTSEVAITYLSFGMAYEFEKFNIGIFCGKDRMFGNLKNWAYQDKWWWGIGVGYDLFK